LLSVRLTLLGATWSFELWLAVIASGLYHGVNPGMGWPLAMSAGLMERRASGVLRALGPLAVGHFAAMAIVLLPFALLTVLVTWSREIRIAAAILVIAFGIFRFVNRRHPRALARIRPTQLALWSFAIAIAHGAGLMLVPIYLGLCTTEELRGMGHEAAGALMTNNIVLAGVVSAIHTLAMIVAGGIMAWIAYRYLGLKFLSRSWFNLDGVWAASLIVVGLAGLLAAL
jgi:hypothetical protein